MLTIDDKIYFEQNPTIFHIHLYGNSNVGKSSLVQKYIHNLDNSSSILSVSASLNSDIMRRNNKYRIESTLVRTNMRLYSPNSNNILLDIFDPQILPCEKKFSFYGLSEAVILMYDIFDLDSFNDIKESFIKILPYVERKTPFFLVGNKTDIDLDFIERRKVSFEDGEKYANVNNMSFFETSVFFNKNINELFESILQTFLQKKRELRNHNSNQIKQKLNTNKIQANNNEIEAIELCHRRRHMCIIS